MRRTISSILFAALLAAATPAAAEDKIDTLKELFDRLGRCFKSPRLPSGHPGLQVTVLVTFTKTGELFGKPKIVYESEYGNDNDRLRYRIAAMEALQRCSPMPFTEGLGGAVAGRAIRMRFDDRRTKSI